MRPLRSRRNRVAASFLLLAILYAGAVPGHSEAGRSQACERWLGRTRKSIESSPTLRQRDLIVLAVAHHACAGVPEALQAAAASYEKARPERAKAQILARGAGAVLRDNCSVADPLAPAGTLVTTCPLPGPGEKAHPTVLGKMRAADYVFLNALMTSLIASNEYSPTAYRIVLDFIISSAEWSENRKRLEDR
jgi:succinate dehydrogenase/fumarate reductase cytochrome b subunit